MQAVEWFVRTDIQRIVITLCFRTPARSHTSRPASAGRPRALLRLLRLEDRVTPTGTPAWAAGAAPGAEARVWVYDSDRQPVRDFLAYEATFTGGVRTSLADLNGDGVPDVVTAPGPGGGPRVRAFDGTTGAELANFYAYDPGFTGGVWVAAGPVSATANGIATGADAGGGPDIRVFTASGVNLCGFFAYDPASAGGVRVALGRTAAGASVYAATGAGSAPSSPGLMSLAARRRSRQRRGAPLTPAGCSSPPATCGRAGSRRWSPWPARRASRRRCGCFRGRTGRS